MFYRLKVNLAGAIQECLRRDFDISEEQHKVEVLFAARPEFGEFSVTFPFELARLLRQAPLKTAQKFIECFDLPEFVEKADIAGGGYINFYLERGRVLRDLLLALSKGDENDGFPAAGQKIIVEHTNINPNKAAHIGHLRNSVLGDSLVKLMRFNGYEVEVQNYIDNTGVQVADVVAGFLYLQNMTLEDIRKLDQRLDYYCWDLYASIAEFYEQSEENKARRLEVLKGIEEHDPVISPLAHFISDAMVNHHLDTMARIGVAYDLLPRESDILDLNFWEAAFERMKANGTVVYAEDGPNAGCWVMNYEKDGKEDTKIIVRSNGTVTYTGKDIAYQLWKLGLLDRDFYYRPFRREVDGRITWATTCLADENADDVPPFGRGDWVYNVIDVRQSYTQNVVYEGVRRLGYPEAADRSIHFSYEMVALSPRCAREMGFELSEEESGKAHVEVSGRRGLGVKADDLIDLLIEKARAEVRRRSPDMPDEEQAEIARNIAIGALRYFMVKYTRNSLIIFDFEDALSFEGDTGPYLQYSVVRAKNILRKFLARYELKEENLPQIWSDLADRAAAVLPDDVWELISTLLKFRDYCSASLQTQEISTLARNLYGMSQKFSNFYNRHQIIGEENRDLRNILMAIVIIYHDKMSEGLSLLGIPVPERM